MALQRLIVFRNSLIDNGIEIRRFKTGTPARVDKRTIDFSQRWKSKKVMNRLFRFLLQITPEDVEERTDIMLAYIH